MIALLRGVFQRRRDVAILQVRVVCQDLLATHTSSQQFQNILHSYSQAPDAWPSAALLRIDRDTVQFAHAHPPGTVVIHPAPRSSHIQPRYREHTRVAGLTVSHPDGA